MATDKLPPLAPALDVEIRGMIAQGNTVAAIKRLREATGCDLVQAKTWVDQTIEDGGFDFRN